MDRSFHREEFHIIIFDNVSYNNKKKRTILFAFFIHICLIFFSFFHLFYVCTYIYPRNTKRCLCQYYLRMYRNIFFFWYKIFVYLFKELMNLFMTLDFECLLCDFNINICTCLCTGTRVDVMEKWRRRWHEKNRCIMKDL